MSDAAPTWAVIGLTLVFGVAGFFVSNYVRDRHPRAYPWITGVVLILGVLILLYA